jgi:8-oxo-dGTP pyrophosphatase MutT (NUDIX family)
MSSTQPTAEASASSSKRLLVHVVVNGRTVSAAEPLVPGVDSWAADSPLLVAPAYEPRGAVLALELIRESEVPSLQSCGAPATAAALGSASALEAAPVHVSASASAVPFYREVEDAERCSAFALACFGLVRCTRAGGADRFLLIRRGRSVRVLPGRISLPGGFLNLAAVLPGGTHVGEGLEGCVRREVEEETGVVIPPSASACSTTALTDLAASARADVAVASGAGATPRDMKGNADGAADAMRAQASSSAPCASACFSSFRLLGMGSAPGGRQHTIMFVFLVTVPDTVTDGAEGPGAAVSGGTDAGAHAMAAAGTSRAERDSIVAAAAGSSDAAASVPTSHTADVASAIPRLFAGAAPRPGEIEETLVWSPAQLAAELDAPSAESFPSIIANILRPHFGGAARCG